MSDFASAFVYSSTLCSIACRCGRVHFVTCVGHGDYEDGEVEQLLACSYAYPDSYMEVWEHDHVEWAMINGLQVVTDCPCGYAKNIAEWLDNHLDEVAKFAGIRLTRRANNADRDANAARGLVNALGCASEMAGNK